MAPAYARHHNEAIRTARTKSCGLMSDDTLQDKPMNLWNTFPIQLSTYNCSLKAILKIASCLSCKNYT